MTWGIIYAYLSQQAKTEAICLEIHGHGDGPRPSPDPDKAR